MSRSYRPLAGVSCITETITLNDKQYVTVPSRGELHPEFIRWTKSSCIQLPTPCGGELHQITRRVGFKVLLSSPRGGELYLPHLNLEHNIISGYRPLAGVSCILQSHYNAWQNRGVTVPLRGELHPFSTLPLPCGARYRPLAGKRGIRKTNKPHSQKKQLPSPYGGEMHPLAQYNSTSKRTVTVPSRGKMHQQKPPKNRVDSATLWV